MLVRTIHSELNHMEKREIFFGVDCLGLLDSARNQTKLADLVHLRGAFGGFASATTAGCMKCRMMRSSCWSSASPTGERCIVGEGGLSGRLEKVLGCILKRWKPG